MIIIAHLCVSVFQDLLERAEWGADLPTVENNLQEHNAIHTAVEELMSSLQEARSYEVHKSLSSTHSHPPVCQHNELPSILSLRRKCLQTSRAVTLKPWPSWSTSTANYWSVLSLSICLCCCDALSSSHFSLNPIRPWQHSHTEKDTIKHLLPPQKNTHCSFLPLSPFCIFCITCVHVMLLATIFVVNIDSYFDVILVCWKLFT